MGTRHPAYNIFKKRFKALLQKTTIKDAAIKTQTSTGSISGWADENKETEPSLSSIAKIAEAFQVSPNYLLGYDKKETSQERVQKIMDYTGLDKNALKALRGYREDAIQMKIINYILSNNILLETLSRYLMTNLYENFANDEDYKYLPKQEAYKDYKLNSYDILEKLSVTRENFTQLVISDKNLSEMITTEFYNTAINWNLCTAYYIATPEEKKTYEELFFNFKKPDNDDFKKMLDVVERHFMGEDYYENLAFDESWRKIVELGLDQLSEAEVEQLDDDSLKKLGLNEHDIEILRLK